MTRKHAWGTALYYLVTLLIAFIAMVPFVWMISLSLIHISEPTRPY